MVFICSFLPLGAALSKPIVRYDIQAKLLSESKTIQGHQVLTWLNDSEIPVGDLRFHLYMNAFKNNRSTFMKESGGRHRGFRLDKDNWGFIDVSKIEVKDGADLTPTMEYIQPDDGNADDQTVMKVTLPAPLKPQESITLVIDFVVKMPKVFARSGFSGDFFLIGQWFPKIGVFWKGEWNCHQYHANSEFFADYGVFNVEITAPERFVVGATGKRVSERRNSDATRTYAYAQEDVHDFAWTACPDFVEFKERFTLADPAVDTEMIFLIHKAHLNSRNRYVQALRNGLEFYSQSYGAYPYATITLVDPAPGATGAGGMEYPTLFTAGTASFIPRGLRLPEMVTIHEFGHGYWYGMVGSNEFEEAWLDEGINTYSEIKAMTRYYGEDRSLIDIGPLQLGDIHFSRLNVIGAGRFDPILKNSWEYLSGGSYSLNVYNKAGLMLLTLERYLGQETMGKVLRTYFETWKFRHPTSADFIECAERAGGRDLKWFFDQFLRSPDKLDYAVSSIQAEEIPETEGIFNGKHVQPQVGGRKADGVQYRNEVVVVRNGEWVVPQDVLFVFENGNKIRETWDGRDRWKRFVFTGPDKLAGAQVDPDGIWVLDTNYTNNSLRMTSRPGGARKIALKIAGWFQLVLSVLSL